MSRHAPARARTPTPFSKGQVARIAEAALQDAGVAGHFPTPIEEVQRALGVRERLTVADLPDAVAVKKPSRIKSVFGAYLHKERTIFIDTSQTEPQVLFTDAHEAIHAACPWHEEAVRWDGVDELFRRRMEEVEGEANYGAGHLIFQGGRFFREALQDRVCLATPLALASRYGASRAATAHYYVEEHPDPVALLVLGRYLHLGRNVFPIWRCVQSESFTERFGSLADRYASGVPADADSVTGGLLADAHSAIDPPEVSVTLADLNGKDRKCVMHAFFNQYVQLLMLAPQQRVAEGRRLHLASAPR